MLPKMLPKVQSETGEGARGEMSKNVNCTLSAAEFAALQGLVAREIVRQNTYSQKAIANSPGVAQMFADYMRDLLAIERRLRAAMTTNCIRIAR